MEKTMKITSIKDFRKFLKLTQIEMGEKVGVGQPVISAWENYCYVPSLSAYKRLQKIAKQKGVLLEI